ncbi:MAG: S8 family serine peptidase [Bacteroidota bacterium]|nr:S8 family serine peptidase [Bacteroidota bacterium]MDX5427310.1 S8 family serine peptidase [Bacteroidota bacterium]MDX5505261.1 S8 family serine peptidase [Bacteroidota bacterium]
MKRTHLLWACLPLMVGTMSCERNVENNPTPPQEAIAPVVRYMSSQLIPDQYIVVLKAPGESQVDPTTLPFDESQTYMKQEVDKILERNGLTSRSPLHVYGKTVRGFSITLNSNELEILRQDAEIEYIEQDQIVALAPGNGRGPGGGGSGTPPPQSTPWGITRVGGAGSGSGKTAWIIDSGVDQDHPDLNVDQGRSVSFLGGKDANNPDDQNGHGTHVAGTIAAIDNTEGVIGVAAGATVVAVRVLDRRGSGSLSGVIAGVNHVAGNAGAHDVANMSLGGGISTTLDNAVISASNTCKFVLAAGNDGINANNSSPARANGNNIYTVSAMDNNDVMAYFSNYGNPPVDYAAPGVSVTSCYKDGGYASLSGTSMAAPHVAGILLLGNITSDGTISGDKDNNPDLIAHR